MSWLLVPPPFLAQKGLEKMPTFPHYSWARSDFTVINHTGARPPYHPPPLLGRSYSPHKRGPKLMSYSQSFFPAFRDATPMKETQASREVDG